ncbi:MAG: hypothetical protein OIN85_09340 [Candidatus Methanoperedens sp.]|nr:hypothetical protein [Candidatus Methanoperedens sp.]
MGRYLTLWETDMTRVPEDPKEQLEFFTKLINMVQEDLKNGPTKEFGMFLGGDSGYTIEEGTEEEVTMCNMKFCPFVKISVQQIISADQVQEIMNKFKSCC